MTETGVVKFVRDLVGDEPVDTSPGVMMELLAATAVAIGKAADEIGRLQVALEGHYGDGDDFVPGLETRWQDLVQAQVDRIVDEHETAARRLPSERRLYATAERRARTQDPILWQDWQVARTRVDVLERWIRNKDKANSARQSVLKGERQ
jgi:hypothetical protein